MMAPSVTKTKLLIKASTWRNVGVSTYESLSRASKPQGRRGGRGGGGGGEGGEGGGREGKGGGVRGRVGVGLG